MSREHFESVHGYKIIEAVTFDNNRGVAIGENPKAVDPYVTWQFKDENSERDYFWGHYFKFKDSAEFDYRERVSGYKENNPTLFEKYNYLASAEMGMEDDYNQIDGIINNGPKLSILDQLREFQHKSTEPAPQSDKPSKSPDREL